VAKSRTQTPFGCASLLLQASFYLVLICACCTTRLVVSREWRAKLPTYACKLICEFPLCLQAYRTNFFHPRSRFFFCSVFHDDLIHAYIFFTSRHLDSPIPRHASNTLQPQLTCGMVMFQDRTILEAACACTGLSWWTDVSASGF
jgi:hypothetical protein